MRSEEGEDVAEGVKGQGFKRIMEEPEPIQDSDAFDENEPQTRQRSASAFKPNDTANLFAYGHEMAAHSQHGFYGGAKPVAPPSYDMPPYSRAPPPLTEVEIAPPASALPEEERLDQVLKEAKALRISETTLLERQKADEAQKSTKPDFKVREDAEREFMARMEAMNQTQKEARMATGLSRIAAEQAGRERIEEERKAEEERKRMEAEMAAQTARVTPGDQLDDKSNKTHTTHYKNAMNAAWSYFGSASDKADGDQVSVLRPTPTMDDHIGGYSAAAFPNNSTANPSQTVDEVQSGHEALRLLSGSVAIPFATLHPQPGSGGEEGKPESSRAHSTNYGRSIFPARACAPGNGTCIRKVDEYGQQRQHEAVTVTDWYCAWCSQVNKPWSSQVNEPWRVTTGLLCASCGRPRDSYTNYSSRQE